MTATEFTELENLLGKLQVYLGHNYCVVPNHVQEGYYLALYNDKGDRFVNAQGQFLKDTAEHAKQQATESNGSN